MAQIPTTWYPGQSGIATSNNYNVCRVTQDGRVRVTQAALVRILNPVTIISRRPTTWINS